MTVIQQYKTNLVLKHGLANAVAVHVQLLVHEIYAVFFRKVTQQIHGVLQVTQGHDFPADIVAQPPLK